MRGLTNQMMSAITVPAVDEALIHRAWNWFDDILKECGQLQQSTRPNSLVTAKCALSLPASQVTVNAQLRRQDIFGNEVYILAVSVNE